MNYKHLLAVPETKEERIVYASTLNQMFEKYNSNWRVHAANLTPSLIATPINDPNYHTLVDIGRVYLGLASDNDVFIGIDGCVHLNERASDSVEEEQRSDALVKNGYIYNKNSRYLGIQKQILCIEDAVEELKFIEDTFKNN